MAEDQAQSLQAATQDHAAFTLSVKSSLATARKQAHQRNKSMPLRKLIRILVLFGLAATSSCAGRTTTSPVPSDFAFVMDVRAAKSDLGGNIHVNVRIDASGKGRFEYYDSDGSISYDLNDMVTYDASQVVKSGKFKLTNEQLEQLWNLLNENRFFALEEHSQMALGYSFAFLLVEVNGSRHMVNNIGMEVPEIKAIVEGTQAILPAEISFEYGKGVKP
jgi:hypothetical protein